MELMGCPGRKSGLFLRIAQCAFAAASIAVMASASGFTTSSAFCYLIVSMSIQFLWCFIVGCLDVQALGFNRNLYQQVTITMFVVGDWVTGFMSLAAACSAAGVVVLITRDTTFCTLHKYVSCGMFELAIAFAFIAWFLLALSSFVNFLLVASF